MRAGASYPRFPLRFSSFGSSTRTVLGRTPVIPATTAAAAASPNAPVTNAALPYTFGSRRPGRGARAPGTPSSSPGSESVGNGSSTDQTASTPVGSVASIPLTPYVRWDTARQEPEGEGGEAVAGRTSRLTAGLNALFFDVLTLKLEAQRILSAPPEVEAGEGFRRDAFLAQAVVTF